jgi:hypothetical protein
MNLKKYFDTIKGMGVMSTADAAGIVAAAVYAKPHIMDDGALEFIMSDRLTHHNLQSNQHANFLFKEEGAGYKDKRLFLTKVKEGKNTRRLESLQRRKRENERNEDRFLVLLKLDRELPLIGDGKGTDK